MTNRLISHVTSFHAIDQARSQIKLSAYDVCDGMPHFPIAYLYCLIHPYIVKRALILNLAFQRHLWATCTSQKRYEHARVFPLPLWFYSCVAGINQSAVSIVNVFFTNIRRDVRSSRIDPDLLSKANVRKREKTWVNDRYNDVFRFLLGMMRRSVCKLQNNKLIASNCANVYLNIEWLSHCNTCHNYRDQRYLKYKIVYFSRVFLKDDKLITSVKCIK